MRWMFQGVPLGLLLSAMGLVMAQVPAAAKAFKLQDAQIAILQADGLRALEVLQQMPVASLSAKDRELRACMLERLNPGAEPAAPSTATDPFVRDVFALFQTYWRDAVLQPAQRKTIEVEMLTRLRTLLGRRHLPSDEEAESRALLMRLKGAGYDGLLGRTGVLLELMVWARQDGSMHRVTLPEGTQKVRVFLLREISSHGWARHLTCGELGTGGWADERGIWAVASSYGNLRGEDFKVNLLAHESQHVADRAYPGLPGWHLEYRAKLVELALADSTRVASLRAFLSDQSDDEAMAHSHANKRVVDVLTQRLGLTDGEALQQLELARLQQAATAELRADTQRLKIAATAARRR